MLKFLINTKNTTSAFEGEKKIQIRGKKQSIYSDSKSFTQAKYMGIAI